MSDVRLIGKLSQAGFNPEDMEGMDRETLLNRYAEVLMGMSAVKPAAVATTGITIPYDVELEKHKIAFQMQQWEETKARWENERIEREADRAASLEREKVAYERDQLRINEERERQKRRMIEESEYRHQQLDLLRKQVEVQEAKNKEDSDRNSTRVSQLKRFGEALSLHLPNLAVILSR